MRLAIVTATFPPYRGGTGNVAYHHARLMHERGNTVTVFTAAQPKEVPRPEFPFEVQYLPVRVRLGNAPWTPSLLAKLAGFDVIHLHHPYIFGSELTMLAARRHQTPFVLTYHNDLIADGVRGLLFKAYTRLVQPQVLRAAKLVMATSDDYARHCFLKDVRGLVVQEVPNGVDVGFFSPGEGVRPKEIPSEAPLALFVGALDKAHHFKGLPILIEAISQLPDWHLAVIGEGDRQQTYVSATYGKSCQNRVHWMGAASEVELRGLYREATVTVLPSTTLGEAFGLVLVESMACGTPVIASDLPGVRGVVPTALSLGQVVPPGDVQALTGALRRSAKISNLGGKVEAVVKVARERFSWECIGDQLEQRYAGTLGLAWKADR